MALRPMPLQTRRLPFDDPRWIFELKYDGFRALAVIDRRPELVSRNVTVIRLGLSRISQSKLQRTFRRTLFLTAKSLPLKQFEELAKEARRDDTK